MAARMEVCSGGLGIWSDGVGVGWDGRDVYDSDDEEFLTK